MIKKLLSAVVLLSGLTFASRAETHTYAANPIDSTTNGGDVVMYNYITNTSSDPADSFKIDWKLVSIVNPNFWTITGFCDNNTCWGDGPTTSGSLMRTSGNIPVGNTAIQGQLTLDVTVPAESAAGTMTVKVRIVNSKSGQVDTVVYNLNKPGGSTSVSNIKNNDVRVTLSPNPTNNSLVVFADKSLNASKLVVLNILGQSVYNANVAAEKSNINVSAFAKGTYLVKIIDNKGQLVTSRQFIKD